MLDLQKASMWKRISAALFDFILISILTVGVAWLLSFALKYDSYSQRLQQKYDEYEKQYGITVGITPEEFESLSNEEKQRYEEAEKALSKDEEAGYVYEMMVNLTLLIVIFSILAAYLILELLIPALLGNGQTLGKKVFGIGVMREDGVKISGIILFARTVLGKYTVETMIPVMLLLMMFFGVFGLESIVLIGVIALVQALLIFTSKTSSPIHDRLAHTVTVDMASQMIFDTPEALLEYKQKLHAESVKDAPYAD